MSPTDTCSTLHKLISDSQDPPTFPNTSAELQQGEVPILYYTPRV